MLCTGIEEFLIADWSSPFGEFVELGVFWSYGIGIAERGFL